jgi:hypothetical protein
VSKLLLIAIATTTVIWAPSLTAGCSR